MELPERKSWLIEVRDTERPRLGTFIYNQFKDSSWLVSSIYSIESCTPVEDKPQRADGWYWVWFPASLLSSGINKPVPIYYKNGKWLSGAAEESIMRVRPLEPPDGVF